MKLATLSALLSFFIISNEAVSSKDADKCVACYGLAGHVDRKLKETEPRAKEEISIGVRIGASGESKPKAVIHYGDSDHRLFDILEGACDYNEKKSQCKELLHDQDERINSWFHGSRADTSFASYICNVQIDGCSAELVESIKKHGEVEVEDDHVKKEEPKTVEPPKKTIIRDEQGTGTDSKKDESKNRSEASSSFDPTAFLGTFVNRIKTNFFRVKGLSIELFTDVGGAVKTKDWNKLRTMVKDPNFYKKYWNVFLWFFIIVYFMFSLVEAIFAKPKARPERRAGTKRKAVVNKKDE